MTGAYGFGREEVTPYGDDSGVSLRMMAMPVDRPAGRAPAQPVTRRDGSTCVLAATIGESAGQADPMETATWTDVF